MLDPGADDVTGARVDVHAVEALRQRRREQMRRESQGMAADPADRALARRLLDEMDALRAAT